MELDRISDENSPHRSSKGYAGDAYHGQLATQRSSNFSQGELAAPTFWTQDDAAEMAFHLALVGRGWVTTSDDDVFGTSNWLSESDVASRNFHAALASRSWVTILDGTETEPTVWIAHASGVSPSYHGRLVIRSMVILDEEERGGLVFVEADDADCRSFHGGLFARSSVTTDDSGVPSFSAWAEADGGVSTTFHGNLMFRSTDSDFDHSEYERTAYPGDKGGLIRSFHGGLLGRSTLAPQRPSIWSRLGRALRRLSSSLVPADDRTLSAPDPIPFSKALSKPAMPALPAPVEVKSSAVGRAKDDSGEGSTTKPVAGGGLFPVG
jgi:hypothetical protein